MLGSVVSAEERTAVNDGINVNYPIFLGLYFYWYLLIKYFILFFYFYSDSLIRKYECMLHLVSA